MSTGKPRDVHKERFWRSILQRWQTSRLSVPAFCQQHQLCQAHFYSWRRTLARRDAQATAFVAVTVLPEPMARGAAPPAALELVLANRRVVRIPPGFDEATLRRLLPLLEEGTPC
jgi:hypothetical protein